MNVRGSGVHALDHDAAAHRLVGSDADRAGSRCAGCDGRHFLIARKGDGHVLAQRRQRQRKGQHAGPGKCEGHR